MRLKGLQLFVALAMTVALAFGISAAADVGSGSGPPTSIGRGGAVASVERLATQAGVDILRHGGNAVDAAVAAAAVLGVTEPFSCGVGGGGFLVLRTADGAVTTIDGRETAPAAMHPTSFWENGVALPFNAARYSGLSVGVPGTVETWVGRAREVRDDVAGRGLRAGDSRRASRLCHRPGVVRPGQLLTATGSTTSLPAPRCSSTRTGRRATSARCSRTRPLPRRTSGSLTWAPRVSTAVRSRTRSSTPSSIRSVSPMANHVWRPGVMTMRDMHRYAAPERAPTHVNYRGLDVYSMGPPSSGGSTVGEALNILEGYDLSSMTARGGSALLPRSVALLVRRPQRLPRRSRLLRRPAERPALRRVRRDAACADHRHGSAGPRPAGRPVSVRRLRRRRRT